ncbi:hypothetical protein EVG20_g10013 [Dentipellis fragilis]|uniref:Methyltransferase type 11 domain-containing protein n=1 Tax=Dentipellis fragilis TaxID=205917 RepID=A0A4Y9XU67_9AGAM|nr:hypothetical protein EVG20_g10013 [Dentipellis fragilis]
MVTSLPMYSYISALRPSQVGRRHASSGRSTRMQEYIYHCESDSGFSGMATYSKVTFNTARYAAARPTYPRQLFDFVFKYHERTHAARWDTAVDLGCGTVVLLVSTQARRCSRAHARRAAKAVAATNAQTKFEFVQSAAEDLSFLEDGSVDLLVAAQSSHWFDWTKMWPEVARVFAQGWLGCILGIFRVPPYAASLRDPAHPRPGRLILDNHFLDVPRAVDVLPEAFGDWEHVLFAGEHFSDLPKAQTYPVLLRKRVTWEDLLAYLRSSSALHTFHERYPEDLKNPDGDLAARFCRSLQEHVRSERIERGESKEQADRDEIDIEWPVAIMLVKRI